MKSVPITPGRLEFSAEGVPLAPDFGDVYHAAAGALPQARHVFLGGNGLPARWAGRRRFVILETGFGLGNNFLAAWDAWRGDARRCERLIFVSIEKHPLSRADLARAHQRSPLPALAAQLVDAWPLATPNLHPIDFEGGQVQLLLGFGDVAALLPQLLASVDAFFLDGFAPARNAQMWAVPLLKRLGRLAAPGATAATWSVARPLRDGLEAAGFVVERAPGFADKREMSIARYAPRHRAEPPPGGWADGAASREALVVGAGLAGCAAAWALARQGWHASVLDRAGAPAAAASGNQAGLFHGALHADDGPHARSLRAAALLTERLAGRWIAERRIAGQCAGLLRLESRLDDAAARRTLAALALPSDYVDWRDRAGACAATGLALTQGGWWFAGGGWLAPRDYAAALLDTAGARFVGGVAVERIERRAGRWHALDATGRSLGDAPVLVLANAADARRLLGAQAGAYAPALDRVRGQLSSLELRRLGFAGPHVPVAGSGYVLPAVEGRLWFGATSQRDDEEPGLRASDHRSNLEALAGLAGLDIEALAALPWEGRVGWRAVTPDRLPQIGALPDLAALARATRADRPRFVPRARDADGGLYLFTGLGSRGIAWAALGAQLLAAWISGAPCPLEADLRDALDPARQLLRAAARADAG